MSTVDYGPTPIKNLRREQLELAYIAAIETRDRALAEVDRLTAQNEQANSDLSYLDRQWSARYRSERDRADAAEARAVCAEQAIQRVEKLCDEAERGLGSGIYGTDVSVAAVRAALVGGGQHR